MSADPIPSSSVPTATWQTFHAREHFVQFYEHDAALLDAVSGYGMKGFADGAAVVIVGTREHLDALEHRWSEAGVDFVGARDQGTYIPLDARATLDRLLLDGWPQAKRFAEVIEPVIVNASKRA